MNVLIRDYTEADPVHEITSLLHRAYKPLADAGWKFVASYQDDARTLSRISSGRCFLAIGQDRIIGTITFYLPDPGKADWPLLYREKGNAHFGQFAVDPAFQKRGLGTRMMDHVERFAMSLGMHAMSFDTSEHASGLINYYRKRGYSYDSYHQWSLTNYRSVVMKKPLKKFQQG